MCWPAATIYCSAAIEYIRARQRDGELVTGLLYIDASQPDLHAVNETIATPLSRLPYADLCPGRDALLSLQKRFR
jgi:2-oxoglutarate ferredoxin oxidoreductase subunit beta